MYNRPLVNHNKTRQGENRVHDPYDLLYIVDISDSGVRVKPT